MCPSSSTALLQLSIITVTERAYKCKQRGNLCFSLIRELTTTLGCIFIITTTTMTTTTTGHSMVVAIYFGFFFRLFRLISFALHSSPIRSYHFSAISLSLLFINRWFFFRPQTHCLSACPSVHWNECSASAVQVQYPVIYNGKTTTWVAFCTHLLRMHSIKENGSKRTSPIA